MAISTSWNIKSLKRRTSDGYVFEVVCTVEASETIGIDTYSTSGMLSRIFEIEEDQDPFIEFEDLTKDQILQWVWDAEGEEEISRIYSEQAKKISIQKGEDQNETVGFPTDW